MKTYLTVNTLVKQSELKGLEDFIAPYAFDGTQLRSITLNEGLLEIGERAFRDTELTRLTLPESLRVISEKAFSRRRESSVSAISCCESSAVLLVPSYMERSPVT